MKADKSPRITLALANSVDRAAICRARHTVYATELGQYKSRPDGILQDALGVDSVYIVASVNGEMAGFVGITPPTSPQFSVDRYLQRADIPLTFNDHLYEIRALTVLRDFRGFLIAGALMYAAFRWVESHGGTRIMAIGRREVLDMYLRVGFKRVGRSFQCGAVGYELISAMINDLHTALKRFDSRLRRMESLLDWQLDFAFRCPGECYHGGAFFDAIGDQFDRLDQKEDIIAADVLDAWFPPAPVVQDMLRKHCEWVIRTSPPTHAEGLIKTIARTRGIDPACILSGGGSSPLIFLALRHWLTPSSRVLILDPMYGEYVHVLEQIIRCRVERFVLPREEGYRLDPERLARKLGEGFDLFVWVNPNNPTGRHMPRDQVEEVLRGVPTCTRVWVDETYVEYAGPSQSLESFAMRKKNVIVCKSLSKSYALSGLRAGYLCGLPRLIAELRPLNPPWAVSLAAQIAAVYALQESDYYTMRYEQTHALRKQLTNDLAGLGISEIVPGIANFVMFHLPSEGPNATAVVSACRTHGIFLRDINRMGLAMGRHAMRMAVKDAATNERMLKILKNVLSNESRHV